MKYKITEREIKAIANGDADIKDLFPDVFNVKLEVGKVYKVIAANSNYIIKIQGIYDDIAQGYGFNVTSFNFCEDLQLHYNIFIWKEATQKEWEEALIKEAERRGYKEGVTIKSHQGINTLDRIDYRTSKFNDGIFNSQGSGVWIMFNGVWATIIPTLTKQKAEEKLKEFGFECKIV